MMAMFSDMVETSIEIFMDDFSVVGASFDDFLNKETNLVVNWEKCHFMVNKGIVWDIEYLEMGLRWTR